MGVCLRCGNGPEYNFRCHCSAYPGRRDRPITLQLPPCALHTFVSHRPADWVQSSLAAHQKFFQQFIDFLKRTFIDKIFGDKVIDIAKKNKTYIKYFFIKVVVVKAQRVEKTDCFVMFGRLPLNNIEPCRSMCGSTNRLAEGHPAVLT